MIIQPISRYDRPKNRPRPKKNSKFSEMLMDEYSQNNSADSMNRYELKGYESNDRIVTLQIKLNEIDRPIPRQIHLPITIQEQEENLSNDGDKVCPECQTIYKKSAMNNKQIICYISPNEKIKVTV